MKKFVFAVLFAVLGALLWGAGNWTYQRWQEFQVMREVVAIMLPEAQAKVRAYQEAQKAQPQPPTPPAAEKKE